MTVEVLAGRHLVAYTDGVVVVVAHRENDPPAADSTSVVRLRELSGLVHAAMLRRRSPGAVLARLATRWLVELADDTVEFGILTPEPHGLAVFLHGGVTAVLSGRRPQILRGQEAGLAVDRVVRPAPSVGAALFVDEDGHSPDRLPERGVFTLGSGVVAGSGAVLWFDEPDGPPTQPDPGVPAVDSAFDVTEPERMRRPAPRPVARSGSGSGGIAPGNPWVVVKGFRCARNHLNDPRVSYCSVCGIRMDQLTCVLTDGIRPPLGVLLLDDGTSYVLDTDHVLGRVPEHSDLVRRGARPIRLVDKSGGMSRVHAEIRLVDWDVTIVDKGSANGTHLRAPGHDEWVRTFPDHPQVLLPGAGIMLGGRVLTFESQHGQG